MADFITSNINGMKIFEDDWKYYNQTPSKNFSPDRNKRIIEESIKKSQALREKKMKEWEEGVRERTEALSFYLKHLAQGKTTPVEKYFARQQLAYLRGQQLLQKVKRLNDGQIMVTFDQV